MRGVWGCLREEPRVRNFLTLTDQIHAWSRPACCPSVFLQPQFLVPRELSKSQMKDVIMKRPQVPLQVYVNLKAFIGDLQGLQMTLVSTYSWLSKP